MGELDGGLEGLCSGEAAGLDEVVVDGEAGFWGNGGRRGGGGEEAVERGDGRCGGGREEMGQEELSEAEHGAARAGAGGDGEVSGEL